MLHKEAFPQNHDWHDTFCSVEIIETRSVPGVYSDGDFTGWKAKGEDGAIYACNWTRFPDDSMTPCWSWEKLDDKGWPVELWYDITYVNHTTRLPTKPKFIDKYKDIIGYCDIHKELYLQDSSIKCFSCHMNKREEQKENKNSWF